MPKALKSMASGKHDSMREQEIHTPPELVAPIRAAFGGTIALDPCAASNPKFWFAEHNITLPENGLLVPWVRGTYYNPPYNKQDEWMEKAKFEWIERGIASIGLGKTVTHRNYFWPALDRGLTEDDVLLDDQDELCQLVFLKAVYFRDKNGDYFRDKHGNPASAPFALGLFCWGCRFSGAPSMLVSGV